MSPLHLKTVEAYNARCDSKVEAYAPLPPAYGQREAEGITTPTCLERTYVASYLSDPMPNIPSSFTFDEARTVK